MALLSSVSTLALLLALAPARVGAITITLTGSDPEGESSFDSGTRWSNGLAPSAGTPPDSNDYRVQVNGRILRSPRGDGTATFAGDSLTLINGGRLFGHTSTVVLNNVILDSGGMIANGGTGVDGTGTAMTLNGVVTVNSGGGNLAIGDTNRQMTVNATFQGSGPLTISRLVAANPGPTFNGWIGWNVAQNYTGNTTINTLSALRQLAPNTLSSGGAGVHTVTGQLQLNTFDASINGLAGGAVTSNNNGRVIGEATTGTQTLTLDGNDNQQSIFAGIIQGANLRVAKTGNSRQVLTGANVYGGGTLVGGGQLRAGSAGALSTGTVTVNGSGTLEIAGGINIANGATLEGRADLTPHIQAAGPSATQSGALALQGTDNFNLSAGTAVNDSLTVSGPIDGTGVAGQTLNLLGAAGTTGTLAGDTTLDGLGNDTIAKSGDGDWTISGATTADGLSVSGGTLALTSQSRTFNTVGVSGGRLDVDSGLSANGVTLTGGTLDLGARLTTGSTVQVSGGTVIQTGSNVDRDEQTGGFNLSGTGAVDLNGADASMSTLDGGGEVGNTGGAATLTLGNSTPTAGVFSGTLSGALALVKDGDNTQTLSGNNTYTGTTTVEDGTLVVASDTALGSTDEGTVVTGMDSGTVAFDGSAGGLTIDEAFELVGRGGDTLHLENVAGSNLVNGPVTLTDNPDVAGEENHNITSSEGTLTLGGGVASALAADSRVLTLGGAGNGVVGGLVMTGTAPHTVVKAGDGEWTIRDASIENAAAIRTVGGVLALADATSIDGSTIFEVATGAELNVANVTGGFTLAADQIMQGTGMVTGNVTTEATSLVGPGIDGLGTLTFANNLTIGGSIAIEISDLGTDLLIVLGELDITGATLALALGGLTANTAYVFAQYANQVPLSGPFPTITGLDGQYVYNIEYAYGGQNQIALVVGEAVPIASPLSLIGLGLFGLAALRRRRSA